MNPRFGLVVSALLLSTNVAACRAPRTEGAAASTERSSAAAPDLVGAWRLVRLQSVRPNGELATGWRGATPSGLLVYLPTGHMAVQIVRDPPATMRAADAQKATLEEKAGAFDGYYAYYGRYEVDEAGGTLRHAMEQSLWPGEAGHAYQHRFQLSGDSLVLTGMTSFELEGEMRHSRLLWVRERRR